MKRLLVIFSILIFPFITFGDLLPEPIDLIDDEGIIYDENIENEINDVQTDISVTDSTENNNINDNNIGSNIEDVQQKLDNTEEEFDPLRWIYFGFCDQGIENSTLSYNGFGSQGEPFKMCSIIYNTSDRDITIQMDLTNAVIDDTDGTNSCTLDFSFGEFLTSGELGKFIVPANNYIIKEFEITFPIGYDGTQKGCISYRAVDEDEEGIIITVRKGYYMDFFVGSLDGIKNELTVTDLQTKLDDNKDLILSFWVENTGNMEDKFDIQGHVKGFFGYDKKFEIVSGQVAPSKSQYIEANLGSLPSYGGKFNIDFTINGTPFFSYDISNANIDPSWLEPKSWDFGTTYFKMPWLILAVVVIFILLLIAMFRKPKQKVIYVQQPSNPQPQQPVQVTQPQQSVQQPVNPQNSNQSIQQ